MKVAVVCIALAATCQAFVPSGMSMSAAPESRRAMIKTAISTAAAVALAAPVLADGSVSEATVQRAKGIYGTRILDLAGAVSAGDFAAVAAEKNAFTLLSTGGFAMASKADKIAAKALTKAVFTAVDAKDKAALQTAYKQLVDLAKIPKPDLSGSTQGYSSDYDWKAKTARGTIYVR